MLAAFDAAGTGRGADLLLEHCATLERWSSQPASAAERLELELGPLAHLLLFALAPGQPRRGSSSP
jgi:hypothetical protein